MLDQFNAKIQAGKKAEVQLSPNVIIKGQVINGFVAIQYIWKGESVGGYTSSLSRFTPLTSIDIDDELGPNWWRDPEVQRGMAQARALARKAYEEVVF